MTHTCHWTGCTRPVPPAMWGCKPHWFKLPKELRDEVWRTYVPGQEITKTPSREYLAVVTKIREWIARREGANHIESVEPNQLKLFGGVDE